MWFFESEFNLIKLGEEVVEKIVWFCIVGDFIFIGCVEFEVDMIEKIIEEVVIVWVIECGAMCGDDWFFEVVMEDCKKEGYF